MKPALAYIWKNTNRDQAVLLRLYGGTPEPVLPEYIGEKRLAGIGDYCFAQAERFDGTEGILTIETEDGGFHSTRLSDEPEYERRLYEKGLAKLCGDTLERLTLPSSIESIGNLAFYNCTSLREIELAAGVRSVGSDVFMNCRRLHGIVLRSGAAQASILPKLLAQISWEAEVRLCSQTDGACEARLLYPEYYESYDEIAPAHLFGRNIQGEGFRARQCFTDGRVAYDAYDKIFQKACAEESGKTLSRMALNRLCYPYALGEAERGRYQDYVRAHMQTIIEELIRQRSEHELKFLTEEGYFTDQLYERAIRIAAAQDWAEGAAELQRRKQKASVTEKKQRYTFEEF